MLVVGAALVLIPFFSELTLLGFTIKQKAEEAKADTKDAAPTKWSGVPGTVANQDPAAVEAPVDDKSAEIRKLETEDSDGFFGSMIDALTNGAMEQGEKYFNKLQEAEPDALQRLRNEGVYFYFRYIHGDSDALDKLSDLAKRTENSPQANSDGSTGVPGQGCFLCLPHPFDVVPDAGYAVLRR